MAKRELKMNTVAVYMPSFASEVVKDEREIDKVLTT